MDTTDWTVEQHIDWMRQHAQSALEFSKMVLSWKVDIIGTYVGMTEVVPWPERKDMSYDRSGDIGFDMPKGARLVHDLAGGTWLIRDKEK